MNPEMVLTLQMGGIAINLEGSQYRQIELPPIKVGEQFTRHVMIQMNAKANQMMTVQVEGSDAIRAHNQIRVAVDPWARHRFNRNGQAAPQRVRHPLAS